MKELDINSLEIWKDIPKYEGLYQISNYGRVMSKERKIKSSNGKIMTIKSKILNRDISNKGYYRVSLSKNGETRHFNVHRLVAQAFIPNPNNYPCVNHKDEKPLNVKWDNLEWCSQKYNCNYGDRNKRISYKKRNKQKINQYDLQGNFIKTWDYAVDAIKFLGRRNSQRIFACCKGRYNQMYGYIWRFENE